MSLCTLAATVSISPMRRPFWSGFPYHLADKVKIPRGAVSDKHTILRIEKLGEHHWDEEVHLLPWRNVRPQSRASFSILKARRCSVATACVSPRKAMGPCEGSSGFPSLSQHNDHCFSFSPARPRTFASRLTLLPGRFRRRPHHHPLQALHLRQRLIFPQQSGGEK